MLINEQQMLDMLRSHKNVALIEPKYTRKYMKLNTTDDAENFIGKHWTENLIKAFRFFWLMAGYYSKYDFATWIGTQKSYVLSKTDWKAWNFESEKYKHFGTD